MRTVLLLVVVCATLQLTHAAAHLPGLKFKGNVSSTIKDNDEDYHYRNVYINAWDAGTVSAGLYFSSKSVGKTKKSASGDSVWGAAYTIVGQFPQTYLASWNKDVKYDKNTDFTNLDVESSNGFIAHSYVRLYETDPSGATVATASLRHDALAVNWQYSVSDKDSNGGLEWMTITGSDPDLPWTFSLTFIVTSVTGVLNLADTVVSPKSLETVVEIYNWPYKNATNKLNLVMGVATGSSTINADSTTVVSGSDENRVYFRLSKSAVISGVLQAVSLSEFQKGDLDSQFNDNISVQLKGKYKTSYDVKLVTVTFPANASSIVYDPTVGAGQDIANTSNSQTLNTYLFCLMLLLLVTFL